ncbi:hypothetical protein AJ88_12295 [Mesorhizobium amorphae CCBAU 01583]|nr:hypothetical protein AJ88_12295 [Mesorhizobium amorphae CCBAU 01583]
MARLGGDEFALILIDIRDIRAAEDIAERLQQKLQEPFKLMDDQVFVSASIGISLSSGGDADADDLLRKADIALTKPRRTAAAGIRCLPATWTTFCYASARSRASFARR